MANTTTLANFEVAMKIKARMVNTNAAFSDPVGVWEALGKAFEPAVTMTSGTGADQADQLLFMDSTVITSANDLDMYNGDGFDDKSTGLDLFGNAVALAEIVSLLIYNSSASAGSLLIGGKGDSTTWTSPFNANSDTVKIFPDGVFALHSPPATTYAVANTTNHILTLTASGGNCTVTAVALGRSA